MKEKENITLIIGQGIAGSVMAFMLHRNNIPFFVIDSAKGATASKVAAGMFTPVTGKRKTLSPLTLQQIPFAIDTYLQISELLQSPLLHQQPVYHVFQSETEKNEIMVKSGAEPFADLIRDIDLPIANLKQDFGAVEISGSGWLDCAAFINGFREWLRNRDALLEETFDHGQLDLSGQQIMYGGKHFANIIFCEGFAGANNPFFSEESIIPCKGDVLTIKVDGLSTEYIIKKSGTYLVALGGNSFKVGATYNWHNSSEIPSEDSKSDLTNKLQNILEVAFKVTGHASGIRPTTGNREVIARQHSIYKNMFMFNGLGTKGVIQAPWWASTLVKTYFL